MRDATSTEETRVVSAMPVLVTGASGHIGSNLVRMLLDRGKRVRALVRGPARALRDLQLELAMGDVRDPAALQRACAGVETVFHLAGRISTGCEPADEIYSTNVGGTNNLVRCCLASGVRCLVHFSSIQALSAVAGAGEINESSHLVSTDDSTRAIYDRAKAEAERIVIGAAQCGLSVVTICPTAVIGRCDFQRSPMGRVLLALARGEIPALVAGTACDFVDVRDVASVALAAQAHGVSGSRYIVSGTRLSFVELAGCWSDVTGRPKPRVVVPMRLASLAAPAAAWLTRLGGKMPLFTPEALRILRTQPPVTHRKAAEELGYRPRAIEDTLRDTWSWMKSEGWL